MQAKRELGAEKSPDPEKTCESSDARRLPASFRQPAVHFFWQIQEWGQLGVGSEGRKERKLGVVDDDVEFLVGPNNAKSLAPSSSRSPLSLVHRETEQRRELPHLPMTDDIYGFSAKDSNTLQCYSENTHLFPGTCCQARRNASANSRAGSRTAPSDPIPKKNLLPLAPLNKN